ncbi:MAG: hypothetical protein OEZ14_03360, partial [Acidimicrobiia bacterium]|nr:hypothetical protein [Acidimicrobiia bacterium]
VPAERLAAETERLRPLPGLRPRIGRAEIRKVDKLSTIRVASARYSVPSALVGARVEAATYDGVVRIYRIDTAEMVATHDQLAPGEPELRDGEISLDLWALCSGIRPRSHQYLLIAFSSPYDAGRIGRSLIGPQDLPEVRRHVSDATPRPWSHKLSATRRVSRRRTSNYVTHPENSDLSRSGAGVLASCISRWGNSTTQGATGVANSTSTWSSRSVTTSLAGGAMIATSLWGLTLATPKEGRPLRVRTAVGPCGSTPREGRVGRLLFTGARTLWSTSSAALHMLVERGLVDIVDAVPPADFAE